MDTIACFGLLIGFIGAALIHGIIKVIKIIAKEEKNKLKRSEFSSRTRYDNTDDFCEQIKLRRK